LQVRADTQAVKLVAGKLQGAQVIWQASYLYDGDGNLARGIVNGVVTFYPGRHYNREVDGANVTVKKFYTLGSSTIAVRTVKGSNDTLNWILGDHLGSASVTANADGTWNSEIKYTAFGEVRASYGLTPTDYRYTGQLEQASINLYWYRSRWFDGELAHFVQADSLIPDPGDPLAWDRYAYVKSNPIKYTDPTGHIACWDNNYGSACFNKKNNPYGFKDTGFNNTPGDNDLLTEKGWKAKEYYERAKSRPGWWNNDTIDVLTPEQFLGLYILFEADGHENDKVYQSIVDAVGYQLFIDNKKQGGISPYCTSEVCVNGIFNNIAAYSGRHMDDRFKTLSQHPTFRKAYGGVGQPNEPFANEAANIGIYIFQRKEYYQSGDPLSAPYHWGNIGYYSGAPFIVQDITGRVIYQYP
jgi:RHS repeat-associated protein